MFEIDGVCKSQCPECGRSCLASQINRIGTIHALEYMGCESIIGDLVLANIPLLTEYELSHAFKRVAHIEGSLVIRGIDSLVSLRFLENLRHVNNIQLSDNPNLVEAVIPTLQSYGSVTVTNCPRLCTALTLGPGYSSTADTSACTRIVEEQYLTVNTTGMQTLTDIALGLMPTTTAIMGGDCASVGDDCPGDLC